MLLNRPSCKDTKADVIIKLQLLTLAIILFYNGIFVAMKNKLIHLWLLYFYHCCAYCTMHTLI